MTDLTSFQAQAATVAVEKLLNHSFFSISDMDKVAKLIGVQLGGKDYEALNALHCVDWGDMPAPLRQQVRDKVCELLGVSLTIDSTAKEVKEEATPKPKLKLAFWK